MKECWSEGALRAYLDRELPPGDMERVAAHLEVCSECGDLWTELAGRAGRVSALMNTLPHSDRAVSIAPAPRRAKTTWHWVGAATALAAGLVLGIVAMPKRQPQPQPLTVVLPTPRNIVPPPVDVVDSVEPKTPSIVTAVARPGRTRPTRLAAARVATKPPSNDGFVALDDEPLDVGVVLRVALGPKEIPADVIFGSDGRPHAIRLVNDKSKH